MNLLHSISLEISIYLFLFFSCAPLLAQDWQLTPLADMPEPVSNNAVVAAELNGKQFVYSFSGIDSTKLFSGVHNKCWRLDVEANQWEALPDLPDPMGRIAMSASLVDGIIYVTGGYHVFANGSELTGAAVHRFDVATNTFLIPIGIRVPIPVDDHVQVVSEDNLIYLITGWSGDQSGGTNVNNVQIYDPANDSWQEGTPVPNNNDYKVFGASGSIIGNKIYYFGGARPSFNFGANKFLSIGTINPNDPTDISWETINTDFVGYRTASTIVDDNVYFLGGSDVTYNYDGIAYNGTGGVSPNLSVLTLDPVLDTIFRRGPFENMPMDLRSLGELSNTQKVIAGGMEANQKVSKKTWLLTFEPVDYVSTEELSILGPMDIFPNPAQSYLQIENPELSFDHYSIYDLQGKGLQKGTLMPTSLINIESLPAGNYIIVLGKKGMNKSQGKFIKF